MFRDPLHSSTLVGPEKNLLLRASAQTSFAPIVEKESYEKNTSTLFTLFDSIVS